MRIKYLASYQGPSYGSMTQDTMDGFTSLWRAVQSVRTRQVYESDGVRCYTLNDHSDVYQLESERYVHFPVTTRDDFMDVYHATWDNGCEGYTLGDWAYRITVGPRGGVRAEKA